MVRKINKYISLFMAVVLVLTFITACSDSSTESDTPATDSEPGASTSKEGQADDAAAGDSADTAKESSYPDLTEHVHFDDILYDQPAALEAYNAFVSEHLGRKFSLNSVPTDARWEKLNTMMLSGEYPDTVELKEAAFDFYLYVQQGHVVPLTEYLKKSEKLKYIMDNYSSVFERYTINGEIYAIPQSKYNLKVIWMRKDWLDNLGLEVPKTTDEFYEVLKAFTYNDPDQNGKDDTIGMVNAKYVHDLLPLFYAFGADYFFKEDENGQIYDGFTQPEMKDALDYIKMLMDEGVLDKEWVTTTNSMQRQMSWSGYNGAAIYWDSVGHQYNIETQKTFPDAHWVMVPTVKGPKGDQGVFENGLGNPWAITKGCENPEQAFEFFEFIFGTPEGAALQNFGPPYSYFKEANEEVGWDYKDGQFTRTDIGIERGDAAAFGPSSFQSGHIECPLTGEVSPYLQEWIDIRPTLDKLVVVQPSISMENDWYAGVAGLIKEKKEELITKYLYGEYESIEQMYEDWDEWWNSINGPINLEKINAERQKQR